MPEAQNHPPQRTWLIAISAVGVGVIGASVFSIHHYAEWKASANEAFFNPSAKTDQAIAILHSRTLRTAFPVYFLFLLGTIPVLVSYLRPKPLWISVLFIILLMSPMLWYSGRVSHVAFKFVDWKQIYPEWFTESSVDRSNMEALRSTRGESGGGEE